MQYLTLPVLRSGRQLPVPSGGEQEPTWCYQDAQSARPGEAPSPAPPLLLLRTEEACLSRHRGTRRGGAMLCPSCGDRAQGFPTGTPGQNQSITTITFITIFFLISWLSFLAPLYLCTSTPASSQIKNLAPVTISPFVAVLLLMGWNLVLLILVPR